MPGARDGSFFKNNKKAFFSSRSWLSNKSKYSRSRTDRQLSELARRWTGWL